MKIKKNEAAFLLAFLGVLVAVIVYILVYNPTMEKTEALEAENNQLAQQVAQLEEWEREVDRFQEETAQMIADVNEVFSHFPAESRSEDAIMYAVELENQDTNTYISSVGITEPALVYEAAPTTILLNSTMEEGQRIYRLYSQQITYTQEFTYSGMKTYVNAIVGNEDRKSIETLNMAYDRSTGILIGTTAMNLYTLDGTDKPYQETMIPSMSVGTSNIFGTREPGNAGNGE